MKIILVLFLIGFLLPANTYAQLGGLTTYSSLNLNGSARAAALGGSYLAMKDGDLTLCLANPSLLDSNVHGDMALGYVNYFSDVQFGFAAYGYRLNKKLTLAGAVQFMNYGDFDQTDEYGTSTGTFKAGDYIFSGSTGYQIDSLFSIGASARVLYGSIASYYSTGLAFDLGATYNKPSRQFSASLVFKNMGWQVTSYTESKNDSLPFELQFGITKRLVHAPFRFSLVAQNLQKWDLTGSDPNASATIDPITGEVVQDRSFAFGDKLMRHMVIGTEFIITNSIHLRIGYNYRRRQELKVADRPGTAGFSYGFGVRLSKFQLSYGRAIYHLAGPSNHFTVTTSLGDWK